MKGPGRIVGTVAYFRKGLTPVDLSTLRPGQRVLASPVKRDAITGRIVEHIGGGINIEAERAILGGLYSALSEPSQVRSAVKNLQRMDKGTITFDFVPASQVHSVLAQLIGHPEMGALAQKLIAEKFPAPSTSETSLNFAQLLAQLAGYKVEENGLVQRDGAGTEIRSTMDEMDAARTEIAKRLADPAETDYTEARILAALTSERYRLQIGAIKMLEVLKPAQINSHHAVEFLLELIRFSSGAEVKAACRAVLMAAYGQTAEAIDRELSTAIPMPPPAPERAGQAPEDPADETVFDTLGTTESSPFSPDESVFTASLSGKESEITIYGPVNPVEGFDAAVSVFALETAIILRENLEHSLTSLSVLKTQLEARQNHLRSGIGLIDAKQAEIRRPFEEKIQAAEAELKHLNAELAQAMPELNLSGLSLEQAEDTVITAMDVEIAEIRKPRESGETAKAYLARKKGMRKLEEQAETRAEIRLNLATNIYAQQKEAETQTQALTQALAQPIKLGGYEDREIVLANEAAAINIEAAEVAENLGNTKAHYATAYAQLNALACVAKRVSTATIETLARLAADVRFEAPEQA